MEPEIEDNSHVQSMPTQFDRRELLMAMRHDCVTFLSFYLGDQLTLEVPDFHIEIWDELLELVEVANQNATMLRLQKLFAVPREHAKSTLAKLAVILFIKYTRLRFVLYASKTAGHGRNAIRDILIWLASPQQVELHGKILPVKSNEGEALWIVDVPIRNHITEEVTFKRVIFKAIGADGQIRGMLILNTRPQIVIVDDIEDNDNTTQDLQPKLDEWFTGAFWKSFDSSQHIVIMLGNMIRKTTLLARLSKDPEWRPTVFGALVRDKLTGELRALWIGKHTVESLLSDYRRYRRLGTGHVWEAEMMNLTQDEIFAADMTNAVRPPTPLPEDLEAGVIILDPSFGKNSWNDDSSITVHGRIKGLGIPCIIDSYSGRITEDIMFDKMLELSYYWGISTWCIEADVAQALILPYFSLLMKDRRIDENTFAMLPLSSNKQAKPKRILAMRSALSNGTYAIAESQEELVDAFLTYNPEQRHEDVVDSAAYGLIAWTSHGTAITERGIEIQLYRIASDSYGEDESDSPSEVDLCAF